MKKILSVILVVVAMMGIGICLTSCEGEDDGYNDVAKHFFGEWETDSLETSEPNGIVWYLAQIVPSSGHAVSPYRIIVKRKDGNLYLYKKGHMGHLNGHPNDMMHFYDQLDAYGSWELKVEWLNKEKTRIALFRDKKGNDVIFHKTKNSTIYEKQWMKN